jgi:hypothetical protein
MKKKKEKVPGLFKLAQGPVMVVHAYNPSTQKVERQNEWEFEANVGYRVSYVVCYNCKTSLQNSKKSKLQKSKNLNCKNLKNEINKTEELQICGLHACGDSPSCIDTTPDCSKTATGKGMMVNLYIFL